MDKLYTFFIVVSYVCLMEKASCGLVFSILLPHNSRWTLLHWSHANRDALLAPFRTNPSPTIKDEWMCGVLVRLRPGAERCSSPFWNECASLRIFPFIHCGRERCFFFHSFLFGLVWCTSIREHVTPAAMANVSLNSTIRKRPRTQPDGVKGNVKFFGKHAPATAVCAYAY